MSRRITRTLVVTFFVALGLWVLGVGCGRSTLDGYASDASTFDVTLPDATADTSQPDVAQPDAAPACGPSTCPSGCCDSDGRCRVGRDLGACGHGGLACEDCSAEGFDYCDPGLRVCAKEQQTCDAATCANGCCVTSPNGGFVCLGGGSTMACGHGGEACVDCSLTGEVCDAATHACKASDCGPATCPGCCASGTCRPGTFDAECGAGGGACENCPASGEICVPQAPAGGVCDTPPPGCNATTCPTGCCIGNQCVTGDSDTACGTGGGACMNCSAVGDVCDAGSKQCVPPPCGPQNCPGCCDAQAVCHAGFLDSRCGSGGNTCADCTQQAASCNTLGNPRACNTGPTTCPSPYAGCPGGSTPVLPRTSDCSASLLRDAEAACAPGPASPTCAAYFQFLQATAPACGGCLAPFRAPFADATGIFNCVAPFVSNPCRGATACATHCQLTSCSSCPGALVGVCRSNVRQGQCSQFFAQSSCISGALFGQGSFCNPARYGGNYGGWLRGVGTYYCAQ